MSLDYVIVREVALAPADAKGFRVCIQAASIVGPGGTFRHWSDDDIADIAATAGLLPRRGERCDRSTWERARRGEMSGHAQISSLDAPVTPGAW